MSSILEVRDLHTQFNTLDGVVRGAIPDVLADKKAQLWINHDKPQSQTQQHAPQFYD